MSQLADKYICSGCHACYNICPKNCITMETDSEGFLYPHIDERRCIDCGRCGEVCPVLHEYRGNKKGQAYACINRNEEIRMKSSSGGVFNLIAEWTIEHSGIVFGAAFDKQLNVKHIEVESEKDLYKLRGSKYLQSRIGDTYKTTERYLKQGRIVLFTGTPCQISGLKAYLGKEYDNLIMQDLICHGVPSPDIWQKYLVYQEKAHSCPIDRESLPVFRLKSKGWKRYSVSFNLLNDTEYQETLDKDMFMKAFLNNLCLRPSCYNCHSKSLERESDITLADFWGVENLLPDMFDDKGTSLVFINSEKGRRLFEKVAANTIFKEIDIDEAAIYNSSAYKSSIKPNNREWFMENLTADTFDEIVNKCVRISMIKRARRIFKSAVKKYTNKIAREWDSE